MLAYQEPEVYNHLEKIQFKPDLYAISWILTAFSHVFTINKVFKIWDELLVNSPALLLFVGISILKHLKNELITLDFNGVILLFSNLPNISIEPCLEDAKLSLRNTPLTISFSRYSVEKVCYQFLFYL